jgi:hypothetical protein
MKPQAATPEQLAALTVPATLPGVVRRGTPIIATAPITEEGDTISVAGTKGTITSTKRWGTGDCDARCVSMLDIDENGWEDGPDNASARLDQLAVDLTDATGRAHLLRAVAVLVGSVYPDTATFYWHRSRSGLGQWILSCPCRADIPSLRWDDQTGIMRGIDPEDETELPDGTLYTWALALRAMALDQFRLYAEDAADAADVGGGE